MSDPTPPIAQCEPTEAQRRIDGGSLLLDVRTPEEFGAGHAPSARFIPLQELESRLGELDPSVAVICICRSGGRSQAAAEVLVFHGFDAANLVGGMQAWAAGGGSVVTDDGGPGTVI